MFAAKKGDVNLLNAILKYHPDVNAKDSKNRNALFYAISSSNGDNSELINSLLNSGINPNDTEYYIPTENIEGHSPLTLAAKLNFKSIMKALLEKKANPNHQVSSNYNSCLHYAIINNSEEMINILIEARANINILNRDDITPINMALKGSNGIIYWKLAHENERLQIENEATKMKNESENINFNKCNLNELKTVLITKDVLNKLNRSNKKNNNSNLSNNIKAQEVGLNANNNGSNSSNSNKNPKNSNSNNTKDESENSHKSNHFSLINNFLSFL
jgi:ankyrin repeat protein